MADIFLSYAREDEAQARRFAHALESYRWSTCVTVDNVEFVEGQTG